MFNLQVSYPEISLVRDLLKKWKHDRFKICYGRKIKKLSLEEAHKFYEKVMDRVSPDWNPPCDEVDCANKLLRKISKVEGDIQAALKKNKEVHNE